MLKQVEDLFEAILNEVQVDIKDDDMDIVSDEEKQQLWLLRKRLLSIKGKIATGIVLNEQMIIDAIKPLMATLKFDVNFMEICSVLGRHNDQSLL